MYKLGINFDEISDDLDTAIQTMQDQGIQYGELRTVRKKNFVFWDQKEIQAFRNTIAASGITLVAAATPLFKWYDNPDDPEIKHDSFGFNPRLSLDEKRKAIDRAISIAHQLSIPRLRIFSGLGKTEDAGVHFGNSELLRYALTLADQYSVDLYIENEPVCKVHTKQEIIHLLDTNTHARLKLWLDIANLVELSEDIDVEFVERISTRLGYIHIKDFTRQGNTLHYVPAGQGTVPYDKILKTLYASRPENIVVTVETHAKADTVEASIASIMGTRQILRNTGASYE